MKSFFFALLLILLSATTHAQIVNWGDFTDSDQTIYVYFNTVGTDGVAETLASGAVEIYEDGSVTQITTAETLDNDFDSITGFHQVAIDLSDAGFENGKTYTAILTAGTVDSVSVAGRIVGVFSVGRIATAGNVGTAVESEINDRLPSATATTNLNTVYETDFATNYDTTRDMFNVDVEAVDDDATSGSGTITFPAETLASTTNITAGTITTATNLTNLPSIPANWITSAGITDGAITAAEIAADAIGASELANASIDAATFATAAIDATAIASNAITSSKIATDAIGASELADNTIDAGSIAADAITAAKIGTGAFTDDEFAITGSEFTAIPWNASWDTEVESEANDALVLQNLDHLVKGSVDTDFATTVHLDSVIGQLVDNGTTATFDRTTDSLEAVRDRGDAAWVTGPTASTIADAIWDEAIADHVGAGTFGLGVRISDGTGTGQVDTNAGAVVSVTTTGTTTNLTNLPSIPTNWITAAGINADAITAAKVADGTIDAATFASGAIDATAIAANAITSSEIATGAITTTTFGTGAIDNAAFNVTETLTANPSSGGISAASFASGAIDNTAFNVTEVLTANVTQLGADAQSLTDLKDFVDSGYDPATNEVAGVTGDVGVDLTQAVPASNTAGTVGDALNAARAQGFGKWVLNSTTKTLTLYGADNTTIVAIFDIGPDLNTPLTRTPQ